MSTVRCTTHQLEVAVIEAAASVRWPDGSLLLDVDEAVLRELLVPRLVTALTHVVPSAPGASS